jgi:hypothetical protein
MQVSFSEGTATVSFGDGTDQLTLNVGFGPVTVSFADGTSAQIDGGRPGALPGNGLIAQPVRIDQAA